MAGLKDIIGSIIAELKAIQAAEDFPGLNHGFPGLIDAGDRGSLLVNENIERSITELSKLLLKNDTAATRQFSNAEWRALVRKSLGPPLASIDLDDPLAVDTVRKEVRKALDQARSKNGDREHAVGCTLFESTDDIQPIRIGPVVIEARHQWLDRMVAEQKMGKVMAKRIRRKWAGGKLAKRKNAVDQIREKDVLTIVGACPFVCSVKTTGLPPESGKQKAITASRMALAVAALAWDKPSSALDGFRLLIDQNLRQLRVLTFEPGKVTLAGSKLSHLPSGYTFKSGEWQVQAGRLAPLFAAAGEVLDFVTHATGRVSRPALNNVLMQAVLWFHEACREAIDAMAVVKFVAVLDGLACGNGEPEIRALLTARVGWGDDDNIYKSGELKMKHAVARLYGEGRSRTVHGTSDRLSQDWSDMRGLAETLSPLALLRCLHWFKENSSEDDPAQLRVR
ncbi:hypothetical protein CN151_17115 [Sinorhizobium meliloti]|uniref:hypothetical protein n=1 Tax=Rhizobium meliloti TaxID=382 RepID=UPI000FD5449F|nr:hypothetical protein [Sinorhizobium meliloti]RVL02585.1 hypothetical protein CN151_17115 [Sinorhizobium meliloti]RVM92114.1 hypothetical protein CN119_17990 [Sinorhizobium meliloti]RVN07369.1 hypothetical protein CN112_19090 [Sinorhizobium meliloti]